MANHDEISRKETGPRPIRALAREAVEDLRSSIQQIESWMRKPFPAESRPSAALRVLQDVAETAQFTYEQRGNLDALRALQLVIDLREIAPTLPPERVKDLRISLETCAWGPLNPVEDFRPVQEQSALIVRAAYVRAGEKPTQPTHSGREGRSKPDILLPNGRHTYAVEVKRPQFMRNVIPRAREAADQLKNFGHAGGIVMDVTDCLRDDLRDLDSDTLCMVVQQQRDALSDEFSADGERCNPGYEHVRMITIMARPPWRLVLTGPYEGYAHVDNVSGSRAFREVNGSLAHWHSIWLQRKLSRGLDLIGFSSFDPPGPTANTGQPHAG